MNFEDEDFDFAEGFLDEVLPPSRVSSRSVVTAGDNGSGAHSGGWAVPAAPTVAPAPASRPDDPGGFSCTPDSVSISQMFGLRGGTAASSTRLPAPAPSVSARPVSPGLSTADPFADDDLMDADLLDACEAAEAAPAAADLPTVSAERPQSRDTPNGVRHGLRDMLDDIGAGSLDKPRGATVTTPSCDTSASSRVHDPGPRDTPISGAFSESESRDTPASSRRRSGGSAVKRRFPGPAGILPITGSLLTLAHEVSLQEDDLTGAGEEDDPSLHDPVSASQLSAAEDGAAWESGPWRHLLTELRLPPADREGLLRRINMAAIRRAAAANQLRKVPLMAALLNTLEPTSDLSYQATFRDPTGQMDATVSKEAFEHCGAALRPGCALLLRDVVVWRESARRLYLSVTRRSLVYLFPETPSGADTAAAVQLSELSAAELAAARLVEEPPEVAVLHESPPPSPPRPRLYPTPQVSGGGGGGGWRGRGGRPWRGRGSGGRPSPYSTPRRGGGGGRSPSAASPAARGSSAASPALRAASGGSSGTSGTTRRPADGRLTASSAGCGPRPAPQPASPALRPYSRPAAAPAPAPVPAAAPRPQVPAAAKHQSETISAAEMDAMFDDDDDVLFGQL